MGSFLIMWVLTYIAVCYSSYEILDFRRAVEWKNYEMLVHHFAHLNFKVYSNIYLIIYFFIATDTLVKILRKIFWFGIWN